MPKKNPRRRFSSEEGREAVLTAGHKLLKLAGVDSGTTGVTLNDAIIESGVPRGSAYRYFIDPLLSPQEQFRLELLCKLVVSGAVGPSDSTMVKATATFESQRERLESGDPIEFAKAFREIIRVGTNENIRSLASSFRWHVYLSSLAATATGNEHPRVLEAQSAGSVDATHHYMQLYQTMIAAFGLKLREEFVWEHFTSMAFAAAQGVALHTRFNDWLRLERPTGPEGEMQEWSCFGVMFESLVLRCFEADKDALVSADISVWVTSGLH